MHTALTYVCSLVCSCRLPQSNWTGLQPTYYLMLSLPDYSMAAERLKNNPRHRDYLEGVSQSQLEKLHIILRDHMQGFSLEHSLSSFCLDPDEDLNKLDDEDLARKKGQMDELFEKNRRRKNDPDFVYDFEVDFTKTTLEKCSWDDESDDGF